MDEIKINNSQFKLVNISHLLDSTKTSLDLTNKKRLNLYRQFVVFIDSRNCKYRWNRVDGVYFKVSLDGLYNTCWCVVKEKGNRYTNITYTEDELKILLMFGRCSLSGNYIPLAEKILLATNCKEAIDGFYSYYGSEDSKESFLKLTENIIKNPKKYTYLDSTDDIAPIYERSRYSVHSLLEDLVKDKASILLSGELTDYYDKVSDSMPADVKIINPKDWCKIVDICGSKSRANLHLRILTKVNVNIPENEYGIESGEKTYNYIRTFCIIVDGVLNQKKLVVKVSRNLENKLTRYKGLIDLKLIRYGELVLDLTKLPVESKNKLYKISGNLLGELVTKYYVSKLAINYLDFLYPTTKTLDKKEEFLENLGIYGNYYHPKQLPDKEITKTGEYVVEELTPIIKNFKYLSGKRRDKIFNEYKRFGLIHKSNLLTNILNAINNIHKEMAGDLQKERDFWKNNLYTSRDKLRNKVFQILMRKDLILNNKKTPTPHLLYFTAKDFNVFGIIGEISVSWKFVKRKITTYEKLPSQKG